MTAIIQNRCSFRTELAECGNRHKKIGYLCFIIITLLTTLPMKRHHLLFLFAAFIAITSSAQKLDNLVELKQKSENPLFHHLDKAPRTPAFECEGYWAWGSSVVKGDDGKYHMFVSRFPKSLPFHPGWMVASEIVHAVSEIPQGPYRFSEVALPARGAILGRTLHTQSTHFEAEREILPYLYGFHPPLCRPYLRTTHPEKPLVYRCPRQQTRGTGRCRLALRSVETLGRAHLEDQAQYFLQFSDLKSLAYHSRRRFGDDDIQGTTLHERLPALGHEPRNGLCSYHRRPLSSAEQ